MQRGILCAFLIIFSFRNILPQNSIIDSLQKKLETKLSLDLKEQILYQLISNLIVSGNRPKVENLLSELKETGIRAGDKNIGAKLSNLRGMLFLYNGDYAKGYAECSIALEESKKNNDLFESAIAYNFLGFIDLQRGDFYKALNYLGNAISYFEKKGEKKKLISLYNNIGSLHSQLGNIEDGRKYCDLALKLSEEINEYQIVPYIYNNLGNYYSSKGMNKEALELFLKAAEVCVRNKNEEILAASYYNIGIIQVSFRKSSIAMEYFRKSLQIREKIGDSLGILGSLNQIGKLNVLRGNFRKSEDALNKAIKLNANCKRKQELMNSYLYYSMLDSARKNYSAAYKWFKMYSGIKDAILGEIKGKEIGRLEAKFEFEKKEEKIIADQKEKDFQNETEMLKKNLWIILFGGSLIFMTSLVVVLHRGKKRKQEMNNKLTVMVEERTREIVTAKEKAEASERIKDDFLSQISHEIRTPLNTIINLSGILNNELWELEKEEIQEVVKGINKSGNRIIRTIELLLNYSEVINGSYAVKAEDIILNIICNEVISETKDLASEKCLAVKYYNLIGNKTIRGDSYSIKQTIKNIVENALIYTDKGQIEISLTEETSVIVFKCQDTGIGISTEFMCKIFEPFNQEEVGYTRKYEGNGLGLALSKKYCDMNNALINCESEKGVGTIFRIKFFGFSPT